jgi:uncharacterized protein (UPF0332 family)
MSDARPDHSRGARRRGCGAQRVPGSFHAAQALIAERTGKDAKTHRGAHVVFARLTKEEPSIDIELRRFLPQSFNLKAVADYELGPDAVIPTEQAAAAIETATRFVTCIAELLA